MLDINRPTLEDTGFEQTFPRQTRSGVQFLESTMFKKISKSIVKLPIFKSWTDNTTPKFSQVCYYCLTFWLFLLTVFSGEQIFRLYVNKVIDDRHNFKRILQQTWPTFCLKQKKIANLNCK